MPHDVRAYVPGGSYLLAGWRYLNTIISLITDNIEALRATFHIDALVILSDQIHCLWTLPPNGADVSTRWRLDQILVLPPSRRGSGYQLEGERKTNQATAGAILGTCGPASK